MPNGVKVFFTVLIIFILVIVVPVMQVLTLVRLTVMNPQFYARPIDDIYEAAYDLALDSMVHAIGYETNGITDETMDRLETAIRNTISSEDVSSLMEESLPGILAYILYGGEAPVIEYGAIVDDVREGFWNSGVFHEMLADRIRYQVELLGLSGVALGEIDVAELAQMADHLLLTTRFDAYYTHETREEALTIVYEAYLAAATGEAVDLSNLPFPDAVDFMSLSEVERNMPFSTNWDIDEHGDVAIIMADVQYAMGIFKAVFWAGWMGVIVLLVLLLLTWMKRPSVFMNITGGLLIADGVMTMLFALSCWLGGSWVLYIARWGHWNIPVRYMDTIKSLTAGILRPIAQISLITGVLVLVGGVTLLILAPIVRKKESAKEKAAA
jgi:hypothetical protein